MPKNKHFKNLIKIIGLLTIVTAFFTILAWINPFKSTHEQLANNLYYEKKAKEPIYIIGIDDATMAQGSLGAYQKWSRIVYSQILETITKYEPKIILLDLLFKTPSRGISEISLNQLERATDEQKIELLKLFENGKSHPEDLALAEKIKSTENLNLKIEGIKSDNEIPTFSSVQKSLDIFINEQKSNYFHTVFKDNSQGLREFEPVFYFKNESIPSLSVKSVMDFYNLSIESYTKNLLKLSNNTETIEIPLENYKMNINFFQNSPQDISKSHLANNIRILSFKDVLNNKFPAEFNADQFKNSIVLIGLFSKLEKDNSISPLSSPYMMPNILIHANAI